MLRPARSPPEWVPVPSTWSATTPAAEPTGMNRGGAMPRPLADQVVVVVGASSGIGRETALELAQKGSSVALAARNRRGARPPRRRGRAARGRALVAPTDVADWTQVEALAGRTVEYFGRLDTWVNAAAVSCVELPSLHLQPPTEASAWACHPASRRSWAATSDGPGDGLGGSPRWAKDPRRRRRRARYQRRAPRRFSRCPCRGRQHLVGHCAAHPRAARGRPRPARR